MGKPIAPAQGIAFAFPDVCNTPTPAGAVPIPYPNIAQLDAATATTSPGLVVGPNSLPAMLLNSTVATSTGDEAGSLLGVKSGTIKGPCRVTQASTSVVYGPNALGVARFLDPTEQNGNNATGMLMSAFPTVLVGD